MPISSGVELTESTELANLRAECANLREKLANMEVEYAFFRKVFTTTNAATVSSQISTSTSPN